MKKKLITWGFVIAAGWFMAVAHAHGDTSNAYAVQVQTQQTQYKTPEDMLEMVPFLGDLPRTFFFGDGYKMKLSGQQLRIDHMGNASRSNGTHQRTCMVGLSYTTPVSFFTTRIDLPLFTSPTLAMSDWTRSSLGDYVLYMSRTPADHSSLQLSISARF